MMTAVRIIARPGIAAGFRLTGLAVAEAPGGEELSALLDQEDDSGAPGVVLVQEDLIGELPVERRAELERRTLPILLPFPAPDWSRQASAGEAYVLQILQRAIGYRVRLR
jgi:vacuolar-type H+-ATPase subunit F/Vma7